MKHVFIVNPVSGKKNACQTLVPLINEAAKKKEIEYVVETTKAPKHAVEIAQKHAKASAPVRLYAVGGDGTLNEVIEGAWQHPNAEVAHVPCGSGNDFVRNFGKAEDFLNIDTQISGAAIRIDLMQVDSGISAAITSTGLDAEVAYNIPKYRRIPLLGGGMAYNISIAEKLLSRLGKQLRIIIDGQVFEDKYLIAAVCNGRTYGGGYCAAPNAKLDDGLLDVVLVKKVSRLRIASIIGKYKKGLHLVNEEIIAPFQDIMQYFKAKEVEIVPQGKEAFILNVDGECGPAARLYAKVMPGAAQFILPADIYKNWKQNGK